MRELQRPSWVRTLPEAMRETAALALEFYATDQYLSFFTANPCDKYLHHEVKEALKLSDEDAMERLYEIADQYPYSSPTDAHPAFDFSMDGLGMVDWKEVLRQLRLGVKSE